MSAKIRCIATKCGICNISVVASYENGGIMIETLVSCYYIRLETTNWTSNR